MAKKTRIPKKPVKVSKRKKTLPTEIDWGKGIPKDRLRYINAQEEELIRRHRSTDAERYYGGIRAYVDAEDGGGGSYNSGLGSGASGNSGAVGSGTDGAWQGNNDTGGAAGSGVAGGDSGSFGDGGDSGSGVGGTGGFGDGGDSGGSVGSAGSGISSGPQGGVVSQSNAADPGFRGVTAAAPSGGIAGLGGAEGAFAQKESELRGGIGGIGDGRITSGNIVSTTAPNYNRYKTTTFNAQNSANALRDTMQTFTRDDNPRNSVWTRDINNTIRVAAGETNPGSVGAGQVVTTMMNRDLVNRANIGDTYPADDPYNKDQFRAIGNERFSLAKPGSQIAGETADRAIDEMMNGVESPNATSFRDEDDTIRTGAVVGGNVYGNFDNVSEEEMADIRQGRGLPTVATDPANAGAMGLMGAPKEEASILNTVRDYARGLFSPDAGFVSPSGLPDIPGAPVDTVPPGHWKREEDDYLTKIGAMNTINKDPYAKLGYLKMQSPEGYGLKIGGNPEVGNYGDYTHSTADVQVDVDYRLPGRDWRQFTDQEGYARIVPHELGHVGSYYVQDGKVGPDEEIRQRIADYNNHPPGDPMHEWAKDYLQSAGRIPGDDVLSSVDPTPTSALKGDFSDVTTGATPPATGFYGPPDGFNAKMPPTERIGIGPSEPGVNGVTNVFKNNEGILGPPGPEADFTPIPKDAIPDPGDPVQRAEEFKNRVYSALDRFRSPDVAAKDANITGNLDGIRGLETVERAEGEKTRALGLMGDGEKILDVDVVPEEGQRPPTEIDIPGGDLPVAKAEKQFPGNRLITDPTGKTVDLSTYPPDVVKAFESQPGFAAATANPAVYTPDAPAVPDAHAINDGSLGNFMPTSAADGLYDRLTSAGGGVTELSDGSVSPSQEDTYMDPSVTAQAEMAGPQLTKEQVQKFNDDWRRAKNTVKVVGGAIDVATPALGVRRVGGWLTGKARDRAMESLVDYNRATPEEKANMERANPALIGYADRLGLETSGVYGKDYYDDWARNAGLTSQGNREGGGDGASGLGEADMRVLRESRWAQGINVPNKGDPDWQAYKLWLKYRNEGSSEYGDWGSDWGWG